MKTITLVALGLLSFVSGSVARSRTWSGSNDKNNRPVNEKSRVTAFVNTDDGLKVQCWEIEDLLPDNQDRRMSYSKKSARDAPNFMVSVLTFRPGATIFSLSTDGVQSTAQGVDFRGKPNLFTVKNGLILVNADNESNDQAKASREDDDDDDDGETQYIFDDGNGDDWFYFEDASSATMLPASSEKCAKSSSMEERLSVETRSGSDTTVINFEYQDTPRHKVLHDGRCNFAGLQPSRSSGRDDPDDEGFRFRAQHQL